MKKLDKILDKHLPDAGLCQRGKILNRQRKERLKADLLNWLQPNKYEKGKGGTVYGNLIVIDEQQLGLIHGEPREEIIIESKP